MEGTFAMQKPYLSYLLRLWQTNDPDFPTWRASLEDPHTRQVILFTTLEMLSRYLSGITLESEIPPQTAENRPSDIISGKEG
jgi:hypothetical protein